MPWRVARRAALECRQNDVRGERDQFRGKCAIAVGVTCAPADVDADVAPHPLALLRPRRERPRRRATEKRDEVAPFQLIEFPRFNISGAWRCLMRRVSLHPSSFALPPLASASVERP